MTWDLGTELNSSPRLAPGIPITAICQEHAMEDSMVKVGLGFEKSNSRGTGGSSEYIMVYDR